MPKHGESTIPARLERQEQKRREKEEAMLHRLKDAEQHPEQHAIAKLIDETRKNKHNVYLATDWHLWKRIAKNQPACKKRADFHTVINAIESTLKMGDLLIYLGDLVDGEFQDKASLKNQLQEIVCKKVLVRGNNDLFDDAFYHSCGFSHVVDAFKWHGILFSHMPQRHDCELNIHGHIHTSPKDANKKPNAEGCSHPTASYWVPYKNHIDVAWLGGRTKPVELSEVIKAQPEFSKIAKECPEHFNEQELMETDLQLFMSVMEQGSSFIHDPWYD